MSDRGPGSVGKGIALTFLLHLLVVPALFYLFSLIPPKNAGVFAIGFSIFGITQFVYIGPAIFKYKKVGEVRTVQGLVIGAAVTFLLCAACDGLFRRF